MLPVGPVHIPARATILCHQPGLWLVPRTASAEIWNLSRTKSQASEGKGVHPAKPAHTHV